MVIFPAVADEKLIEALRQAIADVPAAQRECLCDAQHITRLTTKGLQALLAADRDLESVGKALRLTQISVDLSQALEDFGCAQYIARWKKG